ncbi:enhancer of split mgamma protein-like [Chironomus tepperi]|uniref:enhancer of split mgamma protein-like n=1 Tax=Chironomus tepperi TaxID=113505 RepID=UPI00391F7001
MSSSISSSTSSVSICNKSLERKVRKPKIEKLRRARINTSLEQLKEILLRNTIWKHTQGSRPTKLEKADILEMSVRYIEMLHDKLSTEKSSSKLMEKSLEQNITMETVKKIKCEAAFRDITNQMDNLNEKSNRQQIITDERSLLTSPLWYYNRFNVHQRNLTTSTNSSDNASDKENLILNKMRQFNENVSSISTSTQQSIFSSSFERHWRPW